MRYIPGFGKRQIVSETPVRLEDRMIVHEEFQILADDEHVEQLFVDQAGNWLPGGLSTDRESMNSNCTGCNGLGAGGQVQIHVYSTGSGIPATSFMPQRGQMPGVVAANVRIHGARVDLIGGREGSRQQGRSLSQEQAGHAHYQRGNREETHGDFHGALQSTSVYYLTGALKAMLATFFRAAVFAALAAATVSAQEPNARPSGTEFGFFTFQTKCMTCHGNPNVERAPLPVRDS